MMKKRSLFNMIFGNKKKDTQKYQVFQLLNGTSATWSSYDGQLYENAQIRACIDAIARNGAKLNPKHLREVDENGRVVYSKCRGRIQNLIAKKPNEMMNAYQFYYKIITELYLNNNSFVYISRDENGQAVGLYPLKAGYYQLLEYSGDIYVQFSFTNGKSYVASLKDDIIHLKRFYNKDDVIGGSNAPIIKVMSFKHILDEGIINAIKTTQGIKGVLKTTKTMLKPEDIKNTRDQFVKDFLDSDDGSGIAGLDATTDFKEVNINPQTATDGQIDKINDDIMNYFGVNVKILQSTFNEDEWNAFYESVIEPLSLEMSLEFTNKIFSSGERYHGNNIVFESNRLQYASNNTKVNVVKSLLPYGILTKNEAREIFNLSPVENGDEFIQSLNNINSNLADEYQSS